MNERICGREADVIIDALQVRKGDVVLMKVGDHFALRRISETPQSWWRSKDFIGVFNRSATAKDIVAAWNKRGRLQ